MTTATTTVLTRETITASINEAIGLVNGRTDGVYVSFDVRSIKAAYSGSRWNAKESGMFSLAFYTAISRRDKTKIFRTKKNGTIPLAEIAEHVAEYVSNRKFMTAQEAVKVDNKSTVELVKASYTGSKFISDYVGNGSHVAATATPGIVDVKISFGYVTAEKAMAILAFVASLDE